MIKKIKWNQFPRAALDALYPRRCPVCGEIVTPKGRLICPSCLLRLSPVKSPACQKCGKEVWSEEIEYCPDCVKHRRSFARGMALFNYTEEAARSMAAVKYKNKREYLDFYAEAAVEKLRQYENREEWQFDALVPVPVHPARKRKRGFNQAEVLARELGRVLNAEVRTDILVRSRRTQTQTKLDVAAKSQNVGNAFSVRVNAIVTNKLRHVLIVDDVFTTGATMSACMDVLQKVCGPETRLSAATLGYVSNY